MLVLLLGTVALAVPVVSDRVDAWFFASEVYEGPSPWKVQRRPADPPAKAPSLLAPHDHKPISAAPAAANDYAMEYTDSGSATAEPMRHVQPIEYQESVRSELPLEALRDRLESLGAEQIVVEQVGDAFECRALFPLSPQSSYQKVFSARGSTLQAAVSQVVSEAEAWRYAAMTRNR